MREIKFAQLSDLHLGVHFAGGKLGLSPRCAEQRERELRAAFVLFVETALKEKVDLVLIPGDLFDSETPSQGEVNFVIEQINRLHPIPTFVTSGNHDPYSRTSIYNSESALYCERRSSEPRWLSHVHIFAKREFTRVRLDGVCVTGCAFYEEMTAGVSLKTALDSVPPQPDVKNILIFHGSAKGYASAGEPEVMPFGADELASCGCDYAAIGHYHSPRLIPDSDGWVAGAYSGAPLALDIADTGERCFILGALHASDRRPFRSPVEDMQFVRCDPRQIRRISLDVTHCSNADALESQVAAALQNVPLQDIVQFRLTGRHPPGMPPRVSSSLFENRFHVRCEDESAPDYDLPFGKSAALPLPHDVRSLFLRRMKQRWDESSSPEDRKLIEEATTYGLDALTQGEISLR